MGLVRIGGNGYSLGDVQAVVRAPDQAGQVVVTVVIRQGTPVEIRGDDAVALLDYVARLPPPPGRAEASGRVSGARAGRADRPEVP